ncbi:cardiac-enriched FHL2-interacting protein isoform X2 [Paramisgurnus dabryanus]|uniref:cardiac-enriched FHL2-interacting protein isoform X2 n=1 Tax=Paramisgurnus dabryanus TaxID=90735 RepID=UPI003CCF0446
MLEMSSLEKLHTGRGSMQGHGRFSDGFSDCGGSFMDDTDREVSNLTDRAFRSLCIGEEAIYNDTEFSSPTERHKAFGEEQQQKTESSYGVGEVGAQSETASTFQHSYVDVTHQEQVFKAGSLSYTNNGSKEVTWQQGRSASRVSSLIKAFSSGECYQDRGAYDVIMAKDNFRDPGHESWDKSALLNIHRDLSEFSSGYHQNFMSGPFQTYRNHFYTSDVAAAVAQMDTAVMMKSSQSKFKALNSTNSFFHSEFSPFQLWEDYNRFPFESTKTPGFMSANEIPRWYDSPMYKELKDTHTIPNYSLCESRRFSQDVIQSQRSRSTVMQKAYAVEKRCESETASNCPPWKKSNNFVKNKLPSNRPSTVSPTNEKTCRPDSSLFGNTKVTQEFQHKVEKVVDSAQPSNVTPFNITQLLTPVIHNRQETETSEIQQTPHTPSLSDCSPQGEADPKSLSDAKLLRDSYKTKASSLLFNLKDNRKRVKSTYSPTKFKGLEVTDRNKQPSKLEGRESRFSDLLSPETAQESFIEIDPWTSKNQIQEHSIAPFTPKNHVGDNLTLTSPQIPNGARNYNFHHGSSQGHFLSPDLLTNTESTQRELSSHNLSTQDKSSVTSEGQLKDLSSTVSPTRPEIAKTHLPAHQTSEQRFGSSQNDPKQRQDYVRETHLEYNQNEAVKERSLWDQTGSVNSTDRETLTINGRCEAEPFKGETASQIQTDKQKAIAKQYSPSTNNSFSIRKETYMQKVNEDIKLGRLAKEEDPTFRKTYSDTPVVHDNQLNTFSKDNYQNKASSPPKEGQAYRGLQKYTVKNDLVEMLHSERDSRASSKRKPTQKTSEQRALYAPSDENKDPNVSYQQYRYEANKQWRMTSGNEDKHIKDNAWTLEKTAEMLEHNGTKDNISSRLSSAQQNMLQKTMVSQKELHANSASQDKVSVNKISDQNTSVPSRKEDRFCINDILAIRDNEHANSIKEKNVSVGDLARSENPQNLIKNDTAEQKPNITGAIKEQEAQGYKVPDYSPAAGYLKKDLNNVNEGLANINMDRKDKLMCKNNDRVATGALAYKERGQSKQEILTSKLTAQAQKEILAIKEKGFGKRGIFARNTTKQSMSISSETVHDGQEGHTAKKEKEITADRLKHLFRDITYSSVTQHKEVIKTHNDHPAYGSPPSREQQSMESQEAIPTVASDKKSLATERQRDSLKHDRRPAGDEETSKEAFIRNEQVKNIKTYQPARITEDTQIGRIGLIDINPKEQLAATSPFEAKLNRHLTPSVKTENYTSHNPPALHSENQTMQTEKRNRQAQYKYSEQVVTEPKDIFTIKKDDKSPAKSIEDQKVNSGLNQTSQKSTDEQQDILGLDRYVPKVEKSTVHHNSGLTAAVEQSKNEPIKNSCGIKVSQMTSSSNDMMVQNGNPPAKLLTESAKSQLTVKPQTNTMNPDEEQFKNRNYMHSSGLNPGMKATSSVETTENNTVTTNDLVLPKTKDLETLESLVKDAEAAISKNNTTSINDVKQNKISPVKAVETAPADKLLVSQSESETNKKSLKQMPSDDANESLHKKENAKELRESASDTYKEDLLRPIGTAYKDENPESVKESQKVTPENTISNLHKVAKDSTEVNTSIQHTVSTGEETTQKDNTDLVSMQNVDFTENDSHTEEEPAEEPMIFNIFVSSKTENPSNDEPMIFTICVSSTIYSDEQQNPVQEEDKSSAKTEICVIKVDSIEKDQDGNKSIDHRKTELSSNINAEKETMVRNSEQPAQTSMENQDKPNEGMDKHCKPTEIENISTSNENLMAKYELPDRNHSHLNRSLESKEKSSDDINTQIHAEELRKTSDQQASLRETQLLKKNDIEIKQQANSPVKEQHCDIPSITVLSKMSEKQQITENDKLKLATCSRNDTLIPKDAKNGEKQDHDTENIEAMKQSRRTGDSQLKDKKVEEQVRNTEKVQRLRKTENITDDVSTRKSPLKIEDVSLTAKEPAATSDSTKTATTAEVLKTSISNATVAKHTFNTKLTETTGTGQALSHATKKPQKVDNGDKRSDTFLVQNTITKDQKIEYAKQDDCTGTVQRHSVSAKTKQSETTGTGQTLSHATKKPQKVDCEDKRSDAFLVQNNTSKDQKTDYAKQDYCKGTVQKYPVSAKTKQSETTGTGQTLSHATKKPQRLDNEDKSSDTFLVQNNTSKDQKTDYAKQDDGTGTVQRHSVSATTKQSETTGTGQTLSQATKKPQKADNEDKRSDAFLVQNNNSKDQIAEYAKQDDCTGTVQRHSVSATTKQTETTGTGQTLSHATKKPQWVDNEDKRSDTFLFQNNNSKDQIAEYAKQDDCTGTVQRHSVSATTKQTETTGTGQTLSYATKKPQKVDNEDKRSDAFLVQNNTSNDRKTDYAKQDYSTGTVQRHSVSATAKQSENTGTGQTLSQATKKPQKVDNEDKRSDEFLIQNTITKDQKIDSAKQDYCVGTVQRRSVSAKTKQSETTSTGQTLSHATKKPYKVDNEDKRSDTFLVQNIITKDQNIEYAKQNDCTGTVQRQSVSAKDAQVLQNLIKGDLEEKKTKPDKNQAGFNTHNEITNRMKMVSKNGASTHVNNYLGKGSIIGEDVCAVVKRDQTSFEVPNIHLKDIRLPTNKVSSKQELIEDHKKKESQRETREGVVTENMGNKDFTKQRNLQVNSLIAQNIWMDNMKETGERTPKQKDYLGKEITPPKKDSQRRMSPLLKQEAVQKQERKNSDKIQKEDSGILRPSGHLNNDGNLKVNENRSSFREKKERNSETITDQHQLGKGILEPKGNVSYASQQDNKSDVIPSKPEAAQKNKKVTRPEISALADYARLRVISVENDTKETDILPKIDFYYSHDHSVRGLPQNAHGNVSFLDPVGEFKGEAHSVEREKGKNPKPLQFLQRDKETFSPQNRSNSSFFSAQPKLTDKESNTKPSFMEETNREVHHKISQSKNLHAENHLALQAEARSGHFRSRQVDHEKATENVPHSVRQKSPLPLQAVSATVKTEQNPINTISPAREETEELQYYTVNALDSDVKLKETPKPPQDTSRSEPPSSLDKITHNKDGAHKSEEEINEDRSFLQSLLEYGKVQMTGPRSNSSSPAMGKPTMFKVKDNTIRTSSVTKTVKPCFHRSFSDDFSMGSPMEHLSGSEKGDEEHIQPVNSPVIHEPATASQWLSKSRETRPQNILPSAEFAAKQLKSHQRSQNLEDEDTRCVMSEDVVNVRAPYSPKIFREIHRNTYQRPASACYERPESSCYERPESACSDIRPLGKPPSVPPKTEKGLRRAQRLTTRRMKKAENKTTPENQEQLAPEPIRNVSTVPSSSSLSKHLPVQATPHLSHYSAESNFTTPMHGMVAQPFTMTQRKLLQDPNSGQFFMVDVPLAVKTKTFYDPETGKYVQLNIRPRSQSAHSHPTPVEVLNGPYMLYPGFLPVPASSLPSIRPSSQLSAPTTVTGDQFDPGTDVWKQTQQKYSINSRGQPESAYRSYEHIRDPSLNAQNNFGGSERRTDIITMSELEDFAMESA